MGLYDAADCPGEARGPAPKGAGPTDDEVIGPPSAGRRAGFAGSGGRPLHKKEKNKKEVIE